jgi:hypothetical protein
MQSKMKRKMRKVSSHKILMKIHLRQRSRAPSGSLSNQALLMMTMTLKVESKLFQESLDMLA